LIGIPLRVVVGERGLKDGMIELKWRHQPEAKQVPAASAAETIETEVAGARQRHDVLCEERRQNRAAAREHERERATAAFAVRFVGGVDRRVVRRPF